MRPHKAAGARTRQGGRSETTDPNRSTRRCHANGSAKLETYKENNRLEAKTAQGGLPKSVWDTIFAFANTEGGVIVLGAKERKNGTLEVVGLGDADKMLDDFWNNQDFPRVEGNGL